MFLELPLLNPHRYNWKSSDKLASICLYFLQIHVTNLINHTPAGLQGKNTGTDITLLHSKVTLINISESVCLVKRHDYCKIWTPNPVFKLDMVSTFGGVSHFL
jgi:hypothetical protein